MKAALRSAPVSDTGAPAASILTVERGLQVLRAFRSSRAPVSNAELVRRTGLSKATVSRLTTTLVQLGHLQHVQGGREFELATGPLSIGHAFIEASPLLRRVEPFMQELADRLNLSVALAVGDQLDMLYIAYRISHRIATLRLGIGSLLPMGSTSIGRAWLWGLEPALQRSYLGALKRQSGTQWPAMDQGIGEGFAELESSGVCSVMSGFHRDAYGIAVPVRVGVQRIPMALSCGAADMDPNLAAARKRIAPELRTASVQLEKLLQDIDGLP